MLRRIVLFALALVGCSSSDPVSIDEVVVSEDGDLGKADGASEVKVRIDSTSVWMRTSLEVRDGDDPLLVLRGRSSRNLTDGRGFIMDDIYGDFAQLSARTFEVTWPLSTARGLLHGVDQFVGLDFVHSASRPDHLTTHLVVRPRAKNFTGSSRIYLVAELTPILADGRVMYRLRGHANDHVFAVDAHAGTEDLGAARLLDDSRHFELDIDGDRALALIGDATPITVRVRLEDGPFEKTTTIGASIRDLGMTQGDAYEVWPHECEDTTLACLQGLPAGTRDVSACGNARTVTACQPEVGVFASADDVETRLATADARLDDLTTDASALVGTDRVADFTARATESIETAVEGSQGRWHLDAQAKDAALDATLEGAFDRVYAFPLAGFAPRPAAPGDVGATRQLVADALLGYLATTDYRNSEFGRTYVELAHEFRSVHVESLRAFRETVAREDYPGMPTLDVYVGDWLGTYTEVSVDKTSGAVTNVYVELD